LRHRTRPRDAKTSHALEVLETMIGSHRGEANHGCQTSEGVGENPPDYRPVKTEWYMLMITLVC
jgi:hypothetical protein